MKPVSPVIPGCLEVTYAKNQPEYIPLPAIKSADGMVTTRWHMSWKERLKALLSGSVYLQILTFNQKLQPVKLSLQIPAEYRNIPKPTATKFTHTEEKA